MTFIDRVMEDCCPEWKETQLYVIKRLVDWSPLIAMAEKTRTGLGPSGFDIGVLFRATLLGKFFNASDRELAKALRFRVDFMLFCGISVTAPKPDYSTLCRFRNSLVKADLMESMFDEFTRQLAERGILVEENEEDLSIVDATVIKTAARPRKEETVIAEDRKEDDKPQEVVKRTVSADPDAAWLAKGGRTFYGFKLFSTVNRRGFIKTLFLRPANEGEAPHFPRLMAKDTGKKVLADKAYASAKNRQILKDLGKEDGIMHKATRKTPLTDWQKEFNDEVAKERWKVEQSYGTLKRRFDASISSYVSLPKVSAEMLWKAACYNLLKATNIIAPKAI